jgi:hypothetical protein
MNLIASKIILSLTSISLFVSCVARNSTINSFRSPNEDTWDSENPIFDGLYLASFEHGEEFRFPSEEELFINKNYEGYAAFASALEIFSKHAPKQGHEQLSSIGCFDELLQKTLKDDSKNYFAQFRKYPLITEEFSAKENERRYLWQFSPSPWKNTLAKKKAAMCSKWDSITKKYKKILKKH